MADKAPESRTEFEKRQHLYNERLKRGESGRDRNLDTRTPFALRAKRGERRSEESIARRRDEGR